MTKGLLKRFILSACAMSRSASVDPLQKFKFRITIPGLPSGVGFNKVSGLSHEVDVATYDEGMYDYIHKLPGKEKVNEITCERGVFADDSLRNEFKQTLTNPSFRSTVMIEQLNRFGDVIHTYRLGEAWVSKWEGTDYDSTSSDVSIEKITIQFEYYI